MGTSADYSAPPNWSGMKNSVTRSGGYRPTATKARKLVREHIATNGGPRNISRGRGQLGSGGTARKAAQRLGGFLSSVAQDGLNATLEKNGLGELIGKSVLETVLALVGWCSGTDSDHDSVDARNALSETLDRLCKNASGSEELDSILGAQADAKALAKLMMLFFGQYLFEQFCRVFFSQLVKKHGEQRATAFLDAIKDLIVSSLENITVGIDVASIDWFGNEGKRIAGTIMQNTLAVFG